MRALFHKDFQKDYRRAPQDIQKQAEIRLKFFREDPFNPFLRNHALVGKYKGCRSINISGDWRAIFEEKTDIMGTYSFFIALGTHSQLYS